MHDKAEATAAIARAQQELEQALARIEALPVVDADHLSYAVHALSNYLMVVMTIGHVLHRIAERTQNTEFLDRLGSLHHATMLMKHLVKQLMIPHGDESPRLIFFPLDLVPIARAMRDEYEHPAAAKAISICCDTPTEPVTVWTDRVALGAVVDNLMSNAVKYSMPGGTIRVRAYREEGEGIVSVTDSGPGIAEGTTLDVFERGRTLASRPTGGEPSTGYGLAIARDLIKALGARMWFQNEPQGGATFFVAVRIYDPDRDGA